MVNSSGIEVTMEVVDKRDSELLENLHTATLTQYNESTQLFQSQCDSTTDDDMEEGRLVINEDYPETIVIPDDTAPTAPAQNYSCNICNKILVSKCSLIRHLRIHTGDKSYSCSTCKKQFTLSSNLKRHIKKFHTGAISFKAISTKPANHYSCEVCNKILTSKNGLSKHKKIHIEEKPYSCYTCKKQFTLSSNLKRHIKRFHTGEMDYACKVTGTEPAHHYPCDVCNKILTSKNSLSKHQKIHTGEKPFTCDICYKVFNTSSNLKSHSNIHNKEYIHTCILCNRAFSMKSYLKIHMRVHTRVKQKPV